MRVVFDTNVFIAAALKGGFSEDIFKFTSATDLITLITSFIILDEIQRKLTEKFEWNQTDADFFVQAVKGLSEVVETKESISEIKRDPDDNRILECAIAGKADLIVSSDQDLLNLKQFRGVGIIHPKTLSWTFPEYFKKKTK